MKKHEVKVSDLAGALSKRAPLDLAEDWDNVGLLAGDAQSLVTGVVAAVNLGPEAIAEARAKKANVVVCHHPPIFKPVSKLTKQSSPWVFEALVSGISVIALHTNYDQSSEDTSRMIAEKIGVEFDGFLSDRKTKQLKFITYVPADSLDKVREAACAAGAGNIGAYSQCSFSWEGEGTFLGGEGSNPKVGKAGSLEKAKERRLEIVVPASYIDKVIASARKAHPYEEMAYDIVTLENSSKSCGYGFVGRGKIAFPKLIENVKQTFQLKEVCIAGPGLENPETSVTKVAWSPGAGSSFVGAAAAKGAQVYICGEVGYHQMLEARTKGLTLVVLGHSYSERFFVETVAEWVKQDAEVPVSKVFETIHANI